MFSLPFSSNHPQHAQGLHPSALCFFIAQQWEEFPASVLLILPSAEACSELSQALSSFFSTKGINQAPLLLPGWEQSPYSAIAPSVRIRQERLNALSSLTKKRTKEVILTTLPALIQATLGPEDFLKYTIPLQKNSSLLPREKLTEILLSAGYLKVDPVEDPGTFSIRGEIVDIYPVNRAEPIRVEYFDEEIEKIRSFDPTTQRTLALQSESGIIEVPPASEVLFNPETLPVFAKKLKEFCDQNHISKAVRDQVQSLLDQHSLPDHADVYAPFVYEKEFCAIDYLPKDLSIFWVEEKQSQENTETHLIDQGDMYLKSIEKKTAFPKVESLYQSRKISSLTPNHSVFFVDRIFSKENALSFETLSTLKSSDYLISNPEKCTDKLKEKRDEGYRIFIFAGRKTQCEKLEYLFQERKINTRSKEIILSDASLPEGFEDSINRILVLNEFNLFGSQKKKSHRAKKSNHAEWNGLQNLSDLAVSDTVIHRDHGLGRYLGLTRLGQSDSSSDFLLIEYANNDKLYLPVDRINLIQKYFGSSEKVALERLGSLAFEKTKQRVKDSLRKIAIDLIDLYAKRELMRCDVYTKRDAEFEKFESQFPFEETEDQLKVIQEIFVDLETGRMMDRLVCGDVGFGKTEVAIRAAFHAITNGKQVAVLVPTTILAHQHEQSFKNRMSAYPFHIASLSRFKTPKEQKETLLKLNEGKIDILIGTHRLLSKDVNFKNLGLIIIDEEHRFGVEHKEKLKALKLNTHVLTLSATPIPRTLHMAISGIRDISLIRTPPVERLPIRTFVSPNDDDVIQKAIDYELSRGGQVFFVHNRVQTIQKRATEIQKLVPHAKILIGHAQMEAEALEQVMFDFYDKKANILLCTSIIESGLDLPSANTIIIDRADAFGLAQLYQLRGRVGRSTQRGYCYLLVPPGNLSGEAAQRLEVIQRFVELGSGFQIASHDLEIRGGGNLLGAEQSGSINAVGFELYTELLKEAIEEMKGKEISEVKKTKDPEIKTPFSAFLDQKYIPDEHQRLTFYRRLSCAESEKQIHQIEDELGDRYGDLPTEAVSLLWLIRLKLLLKAHQIDSLTVGKEKFSFTVSQSPKLSPEKLIALLASKPKEYSVTPESKFIVTQSATNMKNLFLKIESIINSLTL